MNLLEAWEKAKENQTIKLKNTRIEIIKDIGEFPRKIDESDKTTFKNILRSEMSELSLTEIFSNDWEIKKEKKTGWINIYKFKTKNKDTYHGYYLGSHISETEEQAKKYGKELNREFVTRTKIEWEE
jgi:hypothetical protein